MNFNCLIFTPNSVQSGLPGLQVESELMTNLTSAATPAHIWVPFGPQAVAVGGELIAVRTLLMQLIEYLVMTLFFVIQQGEKGHCLLSFPLQVSPLRDRHSRQEGFVISFERTLTIEIPVF
ncbi:hypothetical protein AFLA_014195 [Aspergillus flavus NRRL3357]|nr:hypothetical protein AFLA_014195 [Aspergillus flavus NRRL3357]